MTYKNNLVRLVPASAVALTGLLLSAPAEAQEAPSALQAAPAALPGPIRDLAGEGAQIVPIGNKGGLSGYMISAAGQMRFAYVTPAGNVIVGLMFDPEGNSVTGKQFEAHKDKLKAAPANASVIHGNSSQAGEAVTYTLLDAVQEQAAWISFGRKGAPVIYMFSDLNCPFCAAAFKWLEPKFEEIELRIIPIAWMKPSSFDKAAYILNAASAADAYRAVSARQVQKNALEDQDVLPAVKTALRRNTEVFKSSGLRGTPLFVFRKGGSDEISNGTPTSALETQDLLNGLEVIN